MTPVNCNRQSPLRNADTHAQQATTAVSSKDSAGNAEYKIATDTVTNWLTTTLGRPTFAISMLVPMAKDSVNAGIRPPLYILQAMARATLLRETHLKEFRFRVSAWNLSRNQRNTLTDDNQKHIHFCEQLREAQAILQSAVIASSVIPMARQCVPKSGFPGITPSSSKNVWSNASHLRIPMAKQCVPERGFSSNTPASPRNVWSNASHLRVIS